MLTTIKSTTASHRLLLLAIAVAAVGLIFAAGYFANTLTTEPAAADHIEERPDNAQVRIAARPTGDGRVEVALQELGGDGWSERHLPEARFLAAGAEAGQWRSSSPIQVNTHWPTWTQETLRTGTDGLFGTPVFGESRPICVIGHGDPDQDDFWDRVAQSVTNAAYLTRLNVRMHYSTDGDEQEAAIRECTADGAWGIAATLADVDAVGDALREAGAAGVNVMTYNSGASFSGEVNAYTHVGLNDARGGQLVGERLNAAEVSGEIWCVIHEARNVGLEERCDAIDETYTGGTVTRVRAHTPELLDEYAADLAADPDDQTADANISGIIALNGNTSRWALDAAQAAGLDDLFIAGFSGGKDLLAPLMLGRMQFLLWDLPAIQGMLAVNLLLSPLFLAGGNTTEMGGAQILIEPTLIGADEVRAIVAQLPPAALAHLLEGAGVTPEQAAALGLFGD